MKLSETTKRQLKHKAVSVAYAEKIKTLIQQINVEVSKYAFENNLVLRANDIPEQYRKYIQICNSFQIRNYLNYFTGSYSEQVAYCNSDEYYLFDYTSESFSAIKDNFPALKAYAELTNERDQFATNVRKVLAMCNTDIQLKKLAPELYVLLPDQIVETSLPVPIALVSNVREVLASAIQNKEAN